MSVLKFYKELEFSDTKFLSHFEWVLRLSIDR